MRSLGPEKVVLVERKITVEYLAGKMAPNEINFKVSTCMLHEYCVLVGGCVVYHCIVKTFNYQFTKKEKKFNKNLFL